MFNRSRLRNRALPACILLGLRQPVELCEEMRSHPHVSWNPQPPEVALGNSLGGVNVPRSGCL